VQNESTSGVPSAELLAKAKAGDTRAISLLFRRHGPELRQWARGRLPRWARGMADTTDVVQDVLLRTFKRIDSFEDRGKGALRGYLRRSVMNRIHDEMRKVVRRPTGELEERLFNIPGEQPTPFDAAVDGERARPLQGRAGHADRRRAPARGRTHRAWLQLRPARAHLGPRYSGGCAPSRATRGEKTRREDASCQRISMISPARWLMATRSTGAPRTRG
jgi:RNA polymerase sigma factor (sigma-70 family)